MRERKSTSPSAASTAWAARTRRWFSSRFDAMPHLDRKLLNHGEHQDTRERFVSVRFPGSQFIARSRVEMREGSNAMTNRVVITGMGWITPMGHSIEAVWKRLLNGESGIAQTTLFDASTFPTSILRGSERAYDLGARCRRSRASTRAPGGTRSSRWRACAGLENGRARTRQARSRSRRHLSRQRAKARSISTPTRPRHCRHGSGDGRRSTR